MHFRIVEEEMKALSHMADQINGLRTNNNLSPSKRSQSSNDNLNNESVDLDNLFAFLSDVTSTNSGNPILDELSDKIDNLVQDFDMEVSIVYILNDIFYYNLRNLFQIKLNFIIEI